MRSSVAKSNVTFRSAVAIRQFRIKVRSEVRTVIDSTSLIASNSTEATRVVKVNPAFRTSEYTCSGEYELSDLTSMYSGIFLGSPLFECMLRWKVRSPRNVRSAITAPARKILKRCGLSRLEHKLIHSWSKASIG